MRRNKKHIPSSECSIDYASILEVTGHDDLDVESGSEQEETDAKDAQEGSIAPSNSPVNIELTPVKASLPSFESFSAVCEEMFKRGQEEISREDNLENENKADLRL